MRFGRRSDFSQTGMDIFVLLALSALLTRGAIWLLVRLGFAKPENEMDLWLTTAAAVALAAIVLRIIV